jgi:hypothetical protein
LSANVVVALSFSFSFWFWFWLWLFCGEGATPELTWWGKGDAEAGVGDTDAEAIEATDNMALLGEDKTDDGGVLQW